MIISVLSGKGGTGKTTVATNLACSGPKTAYIDCDVEEPNGFLFLNPAIEQREKVNVMVPSIDKDSCLACGQCSKWCQFNALAQVKNNLLSFLQLCHGCGLCTLVCPEKAISEVPREIGVIERGKFNNNVFIHGVLKTGEPMAVPVIDRIIEEIWKITADVVIIDCPPGTSCSVIAAVEKSDFCLLVTEPTPFGLHDLKIAVNLIRTLDIPAGVVVNKADDSSRIIRGYCEAEGIPILMELPFSKRVAQIYSTGKLLIQEDMLLKQQFQDLMAKLEGVIS
ncbi:ATP-binding protein [Phosphitispora fastidiosa]|uniref:ATP-binding protein n=1 Tax=Phosphitispora fastidiosa TaxID=2837202 RepID=UPI001E33EFF9|nr:ATP-binding protein [Phosphitispora fastidiosa]MBU7005837.1 MinD superfamily P-loop ATPase [Phosphitispora fastidiosa]